MELPGNICIKQYINLSLLELLKNCLVDVELLGRGGWRVFRKLVCLEFNMRRVVIFSKSFIKHQMKILFKRNL